MIKIPPYLKKGDCIALTCPGGYLALEKATICIQTLQGWGFDVMVGKTLGSNSGNYFSGADDERTDELQAMLDDPFIKAILFGRGGYGMSRIIDRLDFKKFKKHPKWLIGFSDITLIHTHLFTNYNIASLHAPMAAAFNSAEKDDAFITSLYRLITGKKAQYICAAHELNRHGKAAGKLIGGNLTLLAHAIGTPSDFETKNNILFIEDTGEYIYNIDRMLHQLLRNGKFDKLAGLVVGGFTEIKDTQRPFGQNIHEVIKAIADKFDFPVCFNFPVSHGEENVALKVGLTYQLKITAKETSLKEL